MQLKPRPAWSGCWIALVSPDQPGWDGLYLNCKGSMLNVQNPFDTPGFLRKIWVKGIGRGQTHKAQIVGRWLRGETYDQIQLHTRHSLVSIKRYVHSFVRVVDLHQQGMPESQIAFVLQISEYLVGEYLALYREHDTTEYQARLTEQIDRLRRAPSGKKGAL